MNISKEEWKMVDKLKIDPEKVCGYIEKYIRNKVSELKRDGIIMGLSGGLDSTVVAYLCTRSVGKEKVLGIYMPERDSNPIHRKDAEMVAKRLGIEFKIVDLTPILKEIGIYDLSPLKYLNYIPTRKIKGLALKIGRYLKEKKIGKNLIIESVLHTRDKFLASGAAYARAKSRLRALMLYLWSELENKLVVGCANKTESMIGAYTKFGVDHLADVMPILDLYRSQVEQLARYLKVPENILNKRADPDLIVGYNDKEKIFESFEILDLILLELENGLTPTQISKFYGIDKKKVDYISALVKNSRHMRESPYTPLIRELFEV